MNKLTGKEIIEKLKELGVDVSDFAYYGAENDVAGPNKEVYSQGGEGEGENWKRVYHFTDHDVYLQVSGWYSSYEGVDFHSEWDHVEEVFPKQKKITVYE